ncbi:MAG: hypothetical protein ACLFUB_05770 [Cyclobacteriaceae bacterium]
MPGSIYLLIAVIQALFHSSFVPKAGKSLEADITGVWHLKGQELLINGKAVDQHFEDMARQLQASTGSSIDPDAMAHRFRKSYKGIPNGTVFTFHDNFSYRIDMPGKPSQTGMWKMKNSQQLLLHGGGQVMTVEVKDIEQKSAVFAIRDERPESSLSPGEYTVMELLLHFRR